MLNVDKNTLDRLEMDNAKLNVTVLHQRLLWLKQFQIESYAGLKYSSQGLSKINITIDIRKRLESIRKTAIMDHEIGAALAVAR